MNKIVKVLFLCAAVLVSGFAVNAAEGGSAKPAAKTVKTNTAKKPAVAKTESKNASAKVEYLTKETFKQKVFDFEVSREWKFAGSKPCIIDFYATWCGPCRMISPYLDNLAAKYAGKVDIYKIDVDKERELAQMFGASSIPLLIFVPASGEPQANRGAMSQADLEKVITDFLLKK